MRPLAFLVCFLVCAQAHAQTTDGKKSGIPAARLKQLRRPGYRFLVPTYVPSGFKLTRFGIEFERDPGMVSYTVSYANAGSGAKFSIQMASDGLGDLFFDLEDGSIAEATSVLKGRSPVFGRFEIEALKKGKERRWLLQWEELSGQRHPRHVSAFAEKMGPSESVKIIAGLRWLE